MHQVVFVTLLAGLCAASPLVRDRRQAGTTISNVCSATSLAGPVNFPHPTDTTKFLQCAPGGRMFIIQCPAGEIYNQASSSCSAPQVTTPVVGPTNPCTAVNVQMGNVFFAYPNDNTKFIECTAVNQPNILTCPTRLVYVAARQSCVFVPTTTPTAAPTMTGTGTGGTGTGTGSTGTGTGTSGTGTTGTGGNPCAQAPLNVNRLFFPSPNPGQFFQCDLAGNAYLMNCPAGLVWNQAASQCGTAYGSGTSGNTVIG